LQKKVLVLPRVEQVLGEHFLAGKQPEPIGPSDGGPETIPAADGAVAPIGGLREVEVRLEPHGPAMAASLVGLHSVSHLMAETMSL
jgi:hypothetical protein